MHQKLVPELFYLVNSPKQPLHARNYFKNKIFWKRIIKNPLKVNFIFSFQEKNFLKKLFMAPFYAWGSTASRLGPLWGSSLLFITKSPEIPGTHFIELGRMKGWFDLGATQWFSTQNLPTQSYLMDKVIKNKRGLELVTSYSTGCQTNSETFLH